MGKKGNVKENCRKIGENLQNDTHSIPIYKEGNFFMKERRSHIELMRLLAILLVIAHHFAVHGGFFFRGPEITANMLFLQLLNIGGKIGVNLFVLITGWFAPAFSWRKVLSMWKQLFAYSLLLWAAACLTGAGQWSLSGLGAAALPLVSNQWWFASAWMGLYLLSAVLRPRLQGLSKGVYGGLLVVLGVFWYVFPVLTWLPGRLRELCWFVTVYLLAGFLGRWTRPGRGGLWGILALGAFLLNFLLGWAVMAARAQTGELFETTYFDAHHLLVLLSSVGLFRWFLSLDLGVRPRLNALASHAFGIYLLHDSNYFRYPLWQGLLRCGSFAASAWLIPYALACTAGVFLGALALDGLLSRLLGGRKG